MVYFSVFIPHHARAQSDGDDAYDPFADYSEFDESTDEEADINFFRHGRFFTIGAAVGYRGFTDKLSSLFSSGPTYGIFMSYFFDLRLAIQFGFLTGDHAFNYTFPDAENFTGNVNMTFLNFDLKYYLNTQNLTRGVADLNPYFFGGIAQVYRTKTLSGDLGESKDNTLGLNVGGGIEIPISRKKSYFALQGTYRYFHFKDASYHFYSSTGVMSDIRPTGESYDFLAILGMNF
ncbi:MAG: hypothetical protein C5B49_08605 [Bdellovibrio sp.]|nr:MAG: hypothetical protein C5B49_08605 [Bdellovibrio sp.]